MHGRPPEEIVVRKSVCYLNNGLIVMLESGSEQSDLSL
jgi:hypothetical protein